MASAPNELVGAEQRHKRMKNCVPKQPGDRYCATEKQDIIQLAAGSPCPVLPELNSFSFTTRVSSEKEGNSEGVSSSMSSKKRMQLNAECEDDEALIGESLKFPQICESANPTSNSDEHIVVVRGGDGLPRFGEVIPGACDALVDVSLQLVADVDNLTFKAPVSCVYNPLVYAQNLHIQYIQKHGGRRVEALLVGMNPGPFGMAQTGVPFGDSNFVREFHGLFGKVNSPEILHPKRPVHGLDCQRSEVSGRRLWGWARDRFGCASAFFNRFWVYNYCPLVFMEPSGKNRTPDKLHPSDRAKLELACNKALIKTVSILRPAFVIGIGKYAAVKIQSCNIAGVKTGDIMHPSPANPQANKDWVKKVVGQLSELGIRFDQ